MGGKLWKRMINGGGISWGGNRLRKLWKVEERIGKIRRIKYEIKNQRLNKHWLNANLNIRANERQEREIAEIN